MDGSGQTCADSSCHANGGSGHLSGGLRLDQDEAANYSQVRIKVDSARLPCYPALICPPSGNSHGGGLALSSVNLAGHEQRFDAYQRITKWIAEGALDN
jgi:hypothetical protein